MHFEAVFIQVTVIGHWNSRSVFFLGVDHKMGHYLEIKF